MSIAQLPAEILAETFTYLRWGDTSRSARVCKAWQPLAFANPFYSRDIVINTGDVNAEALAFHWTRFRFGGSKPIHFGIQYLGHSRLVEKELIRMLRAAVPRAKEIYVTIHSFYRMDVERALCPSGGAPHLENFLINYKTEDEPHLDYYMPLGKNLEDKMFRCGPDDEPPSVPSPCPLKCAMIYNTMMPSKSIASFESVTELWFNNVWNTHMDDFPWFLFDCCPNVRHLRIAGGAIFFRNAPYSEKQLDRVRALDMLDIHFQSDTMRGLFTHLPLNEVKELHLVGVDGEITYEHALSRMSYPLVIEIASGEDRVEFNITVRCKQSGLVRHFVEPYSNYFPNSGNTNELLLDCFMDQISELRLQTSIWSFVNPWLPRDEHMPPESVPYYPTVPRLVVSVESEAPHVVSLPTEPLSLPKLEWLVLKGTSVEYGFVYVDARDVVAFANRLTTNPLILELCGAIVPQSSYDILRSRFQEVHMNHPWM